MDSPRFDALTRVFARPASRRQTLAGIVAAALAPLTTAAQPEPANCLAQGKRCSQPAGDARHGHGKHGGKGNGGKGKHHPPSCSKCCSRFGAAGPDGKARCTCKGEGEACANPSQCCGGLCKNGQCTACPDGLTACAGNCVDLQTNAQHCGQCTTSCASGQRCVGGNCVCDGTSCPRGCCDQTRTCQRGTSDQACGVGGTDCKQCDTCTTCDGTTCVNATACCGDTFVCQNGTCVACGANQRCQNGQCVCDATSCPNGCCNGNICVLFAQQTKQQCGTGGAACMPCTGNDTCGGGGTTGVCGCTALTTCPNGQTCGTAGDGCGGTIDCTGCAGCCDGNTCVAVNEQTDPQCGTNGAACAACAECTTCSGGVCTNKPDGADCGGSGSGLHCCNGVCPAPTCNPAGTPCGDVDIFTCKLHCCSDSAGFCASGSGSCCLVNTPTLGANSCASDIDCRPGLGAECECGRCCVTAGNAAYSPTNPDCRTCCSGACQPGTTTCA